MKAGDWLALCAVTFAAAPIVALALFVLGHR